MSGTISSLGIGSGVLTADVIDQLKDADKEMTIKPIERKIELAKQKSSSLDLLTSLMDSFKSSVSSLDSDLLYQSRDVGGNNDYVEVSADAGVSVGDFSIDVTQIAKKNVIESGSFNAKTSKVATGSGDLLLTLDDESFKISYDSNMTLEGFRDKINDVAGDKVTASILQVGEDDYRLVVSSDTTGKDQEISLLDLGGDLKTTLLQDTYSSDTFSSATAKIAENATQTEQLKVKLSGGDEFTFDYDNTTTLQNLADMINDDATASTKVYASVVKKADGEFTLLIKTKNEVSDQSVSIEDQSSTNELSDKLTTNATNISGDSKNVQDSQDAKFKYNGIAMIRSTNTITDIQVGLSIKLLQDSGSANIEITQDSSKISDELSNMVTSYNSLIDQIDKMTLADTETNTVGVFNGDSSIYGIKRELQKIMQNYDLDLGVSLSDYGVSVNEKGIMSFSSSTFETKFNEDPQKGEIFFKGGTYTDSNDVETEKSGLFELLNDKLYSYTKSDGILSNLTSGMDRETKQLEENHKKTLKLLNQRYDSMTARFIEYDAMISKLNAQFSSLNMMIQSELNNK